MNIETNIEISSQLYRKILWRTSKHLCRRKQIVQKVRWLNVAFRHMAVAGKGLRARVGRRTEINHKGKSYRYYYVDFSKKTLSACPNLAEIRDYGKEIITTP